MTGKILLNTATVYGTRENTGLYAMARAANHLTAEGAASFSMSARIAVPYAQDGSGAEEMRRCMERKARELPLEEWFAGQCIQPASSLSTVTVTAAAAVERTALQARGAKTARAGWTLVLTGWIGLEGMLRIAYEKEEELARRFAPAFIEQIKSYDTQIFALGEIDAAKALGVSVIRQLPEGGILAALWDMAKETGLGISADMRRMPVRQETIEVCEYFRLNPYQLTSAGCMLMAAEKGEALADALNEKGIRASVIGALTDSNDKIIRNGKEIRYIDRPVPDELIKVFL